MPAERALIPTAFRSTRYVADSRAPFLGRTSAARNRGAGTKRVGLGVRSRPLGASRHLTRLT